MEPEEIEKNKFEKSIKIPDEVMGLFGEPPLVEGEDPKGYWGLVQAVANDRKPKGFMEWTDVFDFTNKIWEEQRLRRASAGVISGALLKAVMYFLEQANQDRSKAQKYFSQNPIEREQVMLALAQYGITSGTLQAKAAQSHLDMLKIFERMIETRENGRHKLRKEDERRRRQKREEDSGEK
jgi:hypothetical protein